ncbi:hypothetical protein POM88_005460 [Heracleum sosnowskyi]|uniref:Uncharacterized protein n=1 Tax=Heracleum sosnowskyi TaxID=360622 RepID=A0AAD8N4C5_9APIA|nr:hypothetical protein POM88_005460 [Heracleum sosnowskyi]
MVAGPTDELELAGSTLGNSWATVTEFACMFGLNGALETLCGQAFGAKLYNMLAIAKEAASYARFLIPGIFGYGMLQKLLRFIQAQSIIYPLVIFSLVSLVFHIGFTYLMVHFTALGYKGATLATSITFCTKFKDTWNGVSKDAFHYMLHNLRLALASAAMVCLEYWVFEILVFMASLMKNSEVTTSLVAIWARAIAFITFALALGGNKLSIEEKMARDPFWNLSHMYLMEILS